MVRESIRVSFNEFAANPSRVFDRVSGNHVTIVVEKDNGSAVVIKPAANRQSPTPPVSEDDWEAFLSSAGGWGDVDTDKLIEEIYESRRLSTRPPVEL